MHLAVESIRKIGGAWIWTFDLAIFGGQRLELTPADQETFEDMLAEMRCRVGLSVHDIIGSTAGRRAQ